MRDLSNAFSRGKVKLHSLNLSDNKIKDKGAMHLAKGLRGLNLAQRTIKSVNLSNNMISADGIFYLGEQLRFNPQLTHLDLSLNQSVPHSTM